MTTLEELYKAAGSELEKLRIELAYELGKNDALNKLRDDIKEMYEEEKCD